MARIGRNDPNQGYGAGIFLEGLGAYSSAKITTFWLWLRHRLRVVSRWLWLPWLQLWVIIPGFGEIVNDSSAVPDPEKCLDFSSGFKLKVLTSQLRLWLWLMAKCSDFGGYSYGPGSASLVLT